MPTINRKPQSLKPRKRSKTHFGSLIETYHGSYLSKNGKTLLDEPMPKYQAKQAAIDELRKHGYKRVASIESMTDIHDLEGSSERSFSKFQSSINFNHKGTLSNEPVTPEEIATLKGTFNSLLKVMTTEDELKQLCIATRNSGTEHLLDDVHIELIESKVGDSIIKTDKDCARLLGHFVNEKKNFSVQYSRFKSEFKKKAKLNVG